ncbi:MAG: hypothetical protein K8S99_02505 [Planctomycetes bacterium]|nr:hypothetical protein [Planctomycetota bacterium]
MSQTPAPTPWAPLDKPPGRRGVVIAVAVGLVVLVVLPYLQLYSQQFVNFDDNRYITDNPTVLKGLTLDGVKYAFGLQSESQYHPLAWLSHMADVQMFGLDAGMHKLHNLLYHCINAVLLFLLLRRLSGSLWPAAIAAGVWALHPLRVEGVAWASERREVLHTMFGLLAVMAYLSYGRRSGLWRYLLVFVLFMLALMSKPMLVTLPCVFLLLDYWPLHRFDLRLSGGNPRRFALLVLEKAPLIPLVVLSSWFTIIIQHYSNSVMSLDKVPWSLRMANVVVAYAWYITSAIAPYDLMPMYPIPPFYAGWRVVGCAALVLGATGLVLWLGRRRRYMPVGWFLFMGTLVPVIGIFRVGAQEYADRYSYFSNIGLVIMLACGLAELSRNAPLKRSVVVFVTAATAVILMVVTWVQVSYWTHSIALWEHALLVNEVNPAAHNNLATAYDKLSHSPSFSLQEQAVMYGKAMAHWRRGVEIDPFGANSTNLAIELTKLGKYDEARKYAVLALQGFPGSPMMLGNLAFIYMMQERYDDAVEILTRSMLSPWPRLESQEIYLDDLIAAMSKEREDGSRLCKVLRSSSAGSVERVLRLIDAVAIHKRLGPARGLVSAALRCMPNDPRLLDRAKRLGVDPKSVTTQPAGTQAGQL